MIVESVPPELLDAVVEYPTIARDPVRLGGARRCRSGQRYRSYGDPRRRCAAREADFGGGLSVASFLSSRRRGDPLPRGGVQSRRIAGTLAYMAAREGRVVYER